MKKIIPLFFSCLFVLLAVEASYRLDIHVKKPLYRPSSLPDLGWEFTPGGSNAEWGKPPGPRALRVNERGFRDRTTGPWDAWTDKDLRIAILGDSVTAATNVGYEQTYGQQLENLLQQSGFRARVVNFGMDATNTRQHWALAKWKVLPLQPQILLLGYALNDTEIRFFEKLPDPLKRLLRHFHFGVFISQRAMQSIRNRREPERYRADFEKEPVRSTACSGPMLEMIKSYETPAWPETAVWIRRIKELAGSQGVFFGVILLPTEDQVRGICPSGPQQRIRFFLEQEKIPYLDLLPVLQPAANPSYLTGDPLHFNPAGHAVIAKALQKWLEKMSVLPRAVGIQTEGAVEKPLASG